MGHPESPIDVRAIDETRLQQLFAEEFQAFQGGFNDVSFAEAQELRAFLISWIAVFLPEVVPQARREEIRTSVQGLRLRQDFHTFVWYRSLPLDIALFSFTEDYSWLDMHLANIDHHNSELRKLVLDFLSLVAHRLSIHHPELQMRVSHNLEAGHAWSEWCVILLMAARGTPQAKRELLQTWLKLRGTDTQATTVMERLARGEAVTNPFLDHFLRLHQYVCLRLAERRPQEPVPVASFDRPVQAGMPLEPQEPVLGQKLWQRLRSHPLMQSHVLVEGA